MTMTPAERERMNLLAILIQRERDYEKYIQYVKEINELMSQKEKRLEEAGRDTRQQRNTEPEVMFPNSTLLRQISETYPIPTNRRLPLPADP
jgi:hypothetical protein